VRHKPREGSVCRQLSFPTRWSAILADLWPASLGAGDFAQRAEPSGPPSCGLGLVVQALSCSVSGARCSCSGRTWTGPTASPAAPATRTPGAGLHQDQHPHHQQRNAAGAPATPHPRLHQCRPVTDYSCHRPDATAIGQFFEAIPHLAEHAKIACGNAEALFRLAWSQPPTLPPTGAARTPNPDDCGRPSSGHTERSDLRPT
jgi:hypothetical protein